MSVCKILNTTGALTVLHFLRNTEIGDFDATLVVDKDVGALDVAVNNVTFVQVVEPFKNLPNKVFHERFFECAVVP